MIKNISYINIREILNRLTRHPMLLDITLEQVILYTIDFISIVGMPKLYYDKEELLHIEQFRAKLPCDLISINQVKECKSGICLRSMTDNFAPRQIKSNTSNQVVPLEYTFKTQGQVIYTSFMTGEILVSYKAIPIDKDGYPLLIDNPVFLRALELYIKREMFTILFDLNKISPAVLLNTLQQWCWMAGQLHSEFTIPSVSEMESLSRSWNTLVLRVSEFNNGFNTLGNKEYLKLK